MNLLTLVFLSLLQGTQTVHISQWPELVTAEEGGNVTLNCNISYISKSIRRRIVYWFIPGAGDDDDDIPLHPSPGSQFKGRVALAGEENTSMRIYELQLRDSCRYYCMLSYVDGDTPKRTSGDGTQLIVHGPLRFNLTAENPFVLHCEINVGNSAGLSLVFQRRGIEMGEAMTITPMENGSFLISRELSVTTGILEGYQCLLKHSSGVFLLKKTLGVAPLYSEECPHPVLLYASVLVFPFATLIVILIVFLTKTECCQIAR
ncbi:uncharacterized protein LOC121298714 [Polyodon spathula]|uniref:uncharacterized protein LOC121298714 n=1 Tax=Polyodon spathula TaxID=7913 RepID=UPI001B7ED8B1|nr:uncharacterized protein LOC121298714 [Polyodon spathula]XP_041081851.1 uncharacterized protein LOC121298714 [Polyodon spathula]